MRGTNVLYVRKKHPTQTFCFTRPPRVGPESIHPVQSSQEAPLQETTPPPPTATSSDLRLNNTLPLVSPSSAEAFWFGDGPSKKRHFSRHHD